MDEAEAISIANQAHAKKRWSKAGRKERQRIGTAKALHHRLANLKDLDLAMALLRELYSIATAPLGMKPMRLMNSHAVNGSARRSVDIDTVCDYPVRLAPAGVGKHQIDREWAELEQRYPAISDETAADYWNNQAKKCQRGLELYHDEFRAAGGDNERAAQCLMVAGMQSRCLYRAGRRSGYPRRELTGRSWKWNPSH